MVTFVDAVSSTVADDVDDDEDDADDDDDAEDDDDDDAAGEVVTQLTRTDHSQTRRTRSKECPGGQRRVEATPELHWMYCLDGKRW